MLVSNLVRCQAPSARGYRNIELRSIRNHEWVRMVCRKGADRERCTRKSLFTPFEQYLQHHAHM